MSELKTVQQAVDLLFGTVKPYSTEWRDKLLNILKDVDVEIQDDFLETVREKKEEYFEENEEYFEELDLETSDFVPEAKTNAPPPLFFDEVEDEKLRVTGEALSRVVKHSKSITTIATAFFVRLPEEYPFCGMLGLMTNNHVYNEKDLESASQITLQFKGHSDKQIQFIIGDRYRFTSRQEVGLDATFIQLLAKEEKILARYKTTFVQIGNCPIAKGDEVFVGQLYGGESRKLASGYIHNVSELMIEHNAQTLHGSSGSMLLNGDGVLVGIHHSGSRRRRINIASPIHSILKKLKENLDVFWRTGVHRPSTAADRGRGRPLKGTPYSSSHASSLPSPPAGGASASSSACPASSSSPPVALKAGASTSRSLPSSPPLCRTLPKIPPEGVAIVGLKFTFLYNKWYTFLIDKKIKEGIWKGEFETSGTDSGHFGLARPFAVHRLTSRECRLGAISGTCMFQHNSICCDGYLLRHVDLFPNTGKNTVTLELDANTMTLYIFVNGKQRPYCFVGEFCASVYMGFTGRYGGVIEVRSFQQLSSPTISPTLKCLQSHF